MVDMKLGILLSGGKDSLYAAYKAVQHGNEITCCLTIKSVNAESYMFHTPHIDGVHLQAQAMQKILLVQETTGEKERELDDLRILLQRAKDEQGIEGITTGAVGSQYQASRIQKICFELGLHCFNPLWQMNQLQLLEELLEHHFEVLFTGVFAYPLTEDWLGKMLTPEVIAELAKLEDKFCLNPAGEGGELESYVLDCPLFSQKICIKESSTSYDNYAGILHITQAHLEEKQIQKIQKKKIQEIQNPKALLVSCCSNTLHEEEMLRPITNIIPCEIQHITQLDTETPYEHIILSGTGILDDDFLAHTKQIQKLIHTKKILGICAGAELLLPENHDLQELLEVGPKPVEILHEHPLTEQLDGQDLYFLHHLGLRAIPFESPLQGLLASKEGIAAFKYVDKPIFGVQFHPEVSAKQLIQAFLKS